MGYVTYANMSDVLKVSGSNGGNPGEVATMSLSGGSGTFSQYSFKYTLDGFSGSGSFLIPSVDGNGREIVRACIVPGQSFECQNYAGVNDQVGHKMWSGYVYYALRYFAKSGSTFEILMNDANIGFTESNIYNQKSNKYRSLDRRKPKFPKKCCKKENIYSSFDSKRQYSIHHVLVTDVSYFPKHYCYIHILPISFS